MEIENDVSNSTTGTLCQVLYQNSSSKHSITNPQDTCNKSISNDDYLYAFTLGSFYTLTFILITCFMKFIGRGWISCKFLFIFQNGLQKISNMNISGFFLFSSGLCGLSLFWVTNPMMTFIIFTSFLSLGGPVVSIVSGTAVLLFPTNHRAMALCMILTLGRLGTVVGTNFIGAFLEDNCEKTMGVLAGAVFGKNTKINNWGMS